MNNVIKAKDHRNKDKNHTTNTAAAAAVAATTTTNHDNNARVLVEKQINNIPSDFLYKTPQHPSIHSNNNHNNSAHKSGRSGWSSSGKVSLKMDFTPSPLSIFSTQYEQAVVILISSEIIFPAQHVQQQNALMVLLSDKFHLPVKVVDGDKEKYRKRREELFRISGIRGQYPQIFLVDENGGLKYFGNHVALDKLIGGVGAIDNVRATKGTSYALNSNKESTIDTSFFSI